MSSAPLPKTTPPARSRRPTDAGTLPSRAGVPALVTSAHVRIWVLVVCAAAAIGTAGYIVLEGTSFSDALYMTVITLTTVGFREVVEAGTIGRIWTMLLSITGVGLIFGTVGIVAEYIVSEVTSGRREARNMTHAVRDLSGHVVLCGYGRVGSTVALELEHTAQAFVVVDINQESLLRARDAGYLVVEGDATDDATLRAAGIERARCLITTTDSDANNVYVILSARVLNPGLLVVGRATTPDAEAKLVRAGADRVVSPYAMAGRRLAELAIRPQVVDFLDAALSHGELAFSLEELVVRADGSLAGKTVADVRSEGLFVLAIAQGKGAYEANPADGRELQAGESLIVSGSAQVLANVLRHG